MGKKKQRRNNTQQLTRNEARSVINYYTHLEIPVSLEFRLLLARINAGTQRTADYPRFFKLLRRDLRTPGDL